MSAIKEFYHEEICRGMQEAAETIELDRQYWEYLEDAQIIARAEEMAHSELPNFFR